MYIKGVSLPREERWAKNIYWMYSILVRENYDLTRNELIKKYLEENIETRPFFNPIHVMPPYSSGEKLPVAEKLSEEGINLPSFVDLKKEEIEKVAEIIRINQ